MSEWGPIGSRWMIEPGDVKRWDRYDVVCIDDEEVTGFKVDFSKWEFERAGAPFLMTLYDQVLFCFVDTDRADINRRITLGVPFDQMIDGHIAHLLCQSGGASKDDAEVLLRHLLMALGKLQDVMERRQWLE